MEQKDYLLREIEKVGLIIRAITQKIFGNKENFTVKIESHIEEAKEMLLTEINFDLDKFMQLSTEDSDEYLSRMDGFNVENIELIAEFIAEIGFRSNHINSKQYLGKALQLYDMARLWDKTYSADRERRIMELKEAIK